MKRNVDLPGIVDGYRRREAGRQGTGLYFDKGMVCRYRRAVSAAQIALCAQCFGDRLSRMEISG